MLTKVLSFFILNFLYLTENCYASETEIDDLWGDEGSNLILPCKSNEVSLFGSVSWRYQGRDNLRSERTSVGHDNSLNLKDLSREDAGEYTCTQENDIVINRVRVSVRTPPPPLVNVTVIPSSIWALLQWEVADTGGYPIIYFTAQYRLLHTPLNESPDPWHLVLPDKINSASTQIDIYQLKPNTSYYFQVWANNKLGRGEIVQLEATTKYDSQEIELGKHLLEGAETFDTRVWVAAVAIVMGTLLILATVTIYALYKECHLPLDKDMETMELIPNIILNPGYNDYIQSEWSEPDENSNDTTTMRLNNNTVINPMRI